jgi:photosystem II stability/assembly factor-like uncharacterized protein
MRRLTRFWCMLCGAALAMGSVPAGADVAVPMSGWSWVAPRPQGGTLRDVAFSGSRGYAVGDDGVALRTDDGGATWSGLSTGTWADLEQLALLGPDSLVVTGACGLRRSDDGGHTFRRLRVPDYPDDYNCGPVLEDVEFPTTEVGFVGAGPGVVLRTVDGGRSFTRHGYRPEVSLRMAFVDGHTGVAVADREIWRTTDAAASWTPVASVASDLHDVTMVSPTVGYAVGDDGLVARTADAGATWQTRTVPVGQPDPEIGKGDFSQTLHQIACGSEDLCLVRAAGASKLVRLTDGGATANTLEFGGTLTDVAFPSPRRAFAVDFDGAMLLSNDGASAFGRLDRPAPRGMLRRLRAGATPRSVWALGRAGRYAQSADGGRNWLGGRIPGATRLRDIAFAGDATRFALDADGRLFRNDASRGRWLRTAAWQKSPPHRLLVLDPDRVLLAGPLGIRRSRDGGRAFSAIRGPIARARIRTFGRRGNTVAAFGPSGMWITRNGGSSWRQVSLPRPARLTNGELVGQRAAFVVDRAHRLWVTRDLGRRWRRVYGLGAAHPRSFSFADAKHGLMRADAPKSPDGLLIPEDLGFVFRTDDGGVTWRPQLVDPVSRLDDVLSLNRRESVAVGHAASGTGIFATRTAGDAGTRTRLALHRDPAGVTGRLSPARGGENVLVALAATRGTTWRTMRARVRSDGTFDLRLRPHRWRVAVAHWFGAPGRATAGSRPVVLTPR